LEEAVNAGEEYWYWTDSLGKKQGMPQHSLKEVVAVAELDSFRAQLLAVYANETST